jgi:hypothetical protein
MERARLPNMRYFENPHARPGAPLYNRFVTAWERVANQTVKVVFHGTAEQNIESICKTGLDPSLRRGQAHGPGEYFATDAAVSLPYVGPPLFVNSDAFVNIARLHAHVPLECWWYDSCHHCSLNAALRSSLCGPFFTSA